MPARYPLMREAAHRGQPAVKGLTVLRDLNSRRILEFLRLNAGCSCSDLSRFSGLSVPTVVSIVTRLERVGLVKKAGKGSSSGGRPPAILRLNESYGYVAGMHIGDGRIRVGIADLSGRLLDEEAAEIGERSWPAAVVESMAAVLENLRTRLRIAAKRLLYVGVSAPGITDVNNGVVVSVPSMRGWENVPLQRLLEQKLRVPTVVENDVNASALGEHAHGIAQGEQNFVFIHVGIGVGAGLFVNGHLHHGPEWTAGEIGYLLPHGDSIQPVRKSQVGALEAAIGSQGIERQWHELAGGSLSSLEILDRAGQCDPQAEQILDRIAGHLAIVCSYLSLILNCSLIVFGGDIGMHPALLRATGARLEDHDFAHPRLAVTQLGGKSELVGAVCLALEAYWGTLEREGFAATVIAE